MTAQRLVVNCAKVILTSKIPAPDPLDMYPCPIRMRAQSFQNQRITTVGSSKPQPYPAQECLFGRDTLIGGFESTRIPQMPLVEFFAPVMLGKLVLQLQDRFPQEIFGRKTWTYKFRLILSKRWIRFLYGTFSQFQYGGHWKILEISKLRGGRIEKLKKIPKKWKENRKHLSLNCRESLL